jgi:hypothetical protein
MLRESQGNRNSRSWGWRNKGRIVSGHGLECGDDEMMRKRSKLLTLPASYRSCIGWAMTVSSFWRAIRIRPGWR